MKNKQAKKAIKKALKEKHILPWGAYREAKNIYQQEYACALESHTDPSEAEGLATRKAIEAIEKRPSWNHGPLFAMIFTLVLFVFFSGEPIYEAAGDWASWYVVYEFFAMFGVALYFVITRNHRRKVDWILFAIIAASVLIGFAQASTRLIIVSSRIKRYREAYYYPGVYITHLDWYDAEAPEQYLGSSNWCVFFFPEVLTALGCFIFSVISYRKTKKERKNPAK